MRAQAIKEKAEMIYKIEDKPKTFKELLLYSCQMMLAVFVASVLIANLCGVDTGAALVGACYGTLVYILYTEAQSPMFISNSGNFVAPVIMALATAGYFGVFIGGVTTCIIYCIFGIIFTKLPVDSIYKVFPPALIGAVTVVIGITLMGFIPGYIGETGQWGTAIALVTMIIIALISHYAEGVAKVLPFLLGILSGYIIAVILTLTNIVKLVDFSVFKGAKLLQMPDFAFTHWEFSISWMSIISIMIIYTCYSVSQICECLADHAALGGIIGVDLYRKPGLTKIFIGEGLSNLMSSAIGGLGSTSYGEGISVVGFSRVASIWVTGGAAILLGILGFAGYVQAFIASIPGCVFAGAAIILYGYIAASGIKMLQKVNLNNNKSLVLTASVLSIGIGGLIIGGVDLAITGTALALIMGIVINLILSDKEN